MYQGQRHKSVRASASRPGRGISQIEHSITCQVRVTRCVIKPVHMLHEASFAKFVCEKAQRTQISCGIPEKSVFLVADVRKAFLFVDMFSVQFHRWHRAVLSFVFWIRLPGCCKDVPRINKD